MGAGDIVDDVPIVHEDVRSATQVNPAPVDVGGIVRDRRILVAHANVAKVGTVNASPKFGAIVIESAGGAPAAVSYVEVAIVEVNAAPVPIVVAVAVGHVAAQAGGSDKTVNNRNRAAAGAVDPAAVAGGAVAADARAVVQDQ